MFSFFCHCKSIETINPQGVAKFDPMDMACIIYVDDHLPLPHTKYQSCGPFGFRQFFFNFIFH